MRVFPVLFATVVLMAVSSGLMVSAQVDVDITTFSHPDILEVKRGGGWILNGYSSGDPTSPVNRLAAFTWSPVGDQPKIIYFGEVFDFEHSSSNIVAPMCI